TLCKRVRVGDRTLYHSQRSRRATGIRSPVRLRTKNCPISNTHIFKSPTQQLIINRLQKWHNIIGNFRQRTIIQSFFNRALASSSLDNFDLLIFTSFNGQTDTTEEMEYQTHLNNSRRCRYRWTYRRKLLLYQWQ